MFHVSISTINSTDRCDACHSLDSRPMLSISSSTGRGRTRQRDIIIVHEECLTRKIAQAKRHLEPKKPTVPSVL